MGFQTVRLYLVKTCLVTWPEEQDERPADNTWNSGIQKSIDGHASCATLLQILGIGMEINLIFNMRKHDKIIRTAR